MNFVGSLLKLDFILDIVIQEYSDSGVSLEHQLL